ncbi:MAG: ATP-binding protein, partial [Methanosarcinales archaeon]|nr:ATP-binding protein [Methanosarcinales archaeon]
NIISQTLNNPLIRKGDFTWEELFELIANEEKLIIAFDEFPNLISENKALLSKFGKIWDELLKNTTVKLILCGSSISMMENYLLNYKSPLYGRRTGQLLVKPLKAMHIIEFGATTFEEAVEIFGITDGIPEYIKEVCYRLKHNERLDEVFQPNKSLFSEAEILIKSELRDPTRYFSILKAIAFGKTKFGEIVNYTDFPTATVSKYLSNLINLHIVEESYPMHDDKELRRNRRYYLSDNYFNFYFRFIYPNKSEMILNGQITGFYSDYNRYLGKIFEKISKEFLEKSTGLLPFKFSRIGKWWYKDKEIDLIVLNDETKEILFIECKWKRLDYRSVIKIIKSLKEKSKSFEWNNDKRKEYFGIISREIRNKEQLLKDGFIVFDMDDF